ncbi:FAD-dependent oxidoreductase [Nocardioides stalactiti]|uniref:FAD-dependent oxidoreductase n=1 Tax=Nocardioides stalactiti TaxID=2755356 RepID=UPI0015FFD9A9|nr:FAD-dependent oxidoreductase [Nocardioides stalactiti]
MTPRRLAVVGSGVAGLTAAYVASRTAEVTLYEADDRLGGHADTHRVPDAATGQDLAIDTGFIVHNRSTYPVLLRLFDELGVATQESEMSMSTSDEETGLEWAGALGARGLFPRRANLHDPRYLRMLADIPRFHRMARRLLATVDDGGEVSPDLTVAVFLERGGFSPYFRRHFVEPLIAAVWSCDPTVATEYPAAYLFTFLRHHGMLGVFGSPAWRTVSGGSRSYVDKVAAALVASGGGVRLSAPVDAIIETADGVRVRTAVDEQEYDAVVVATHPDQALSLLADPSQVQQEILGALPYSANTALLHTDTSLLPAAANAWASWNFRRPAATQDAVLVTYDLTRLQRLPTPTHYLVTLGGEHLVDPATVIARRDYAHPLYTTTSVAARERLREIDTDRVVFAGAYHGWGFHEDGARSGLAAVERLGLRWPPAVLPDRAPAAETHLEPTPYLTTITHTRRAPMRRSFRHRSRTWVVDLDRLPARGRLSWLTGRWDARDHFDGDAATIRQAFDRFLEEHGTDTREGRVLMVAHPRALGHCFNPITVFWWWADPRGRGRPDATVVEVHNTYGDRHAYLVPTDHHGAGRVDKALYVSPFHGTDGHYRVVAPPPDPASGNLSVSVTLHTEDGTRFSATVTGTPARRAPSVALSALRGAALIRLHGIVLWLRGLPVQPRPTYRPPELPVSTTPSTTPSTTRTAIPPAPRTGGVR